MTLRIETRHFAGWAESQGRNHLDYGRNLVSRKRLMTELEDFVPQFANLLGWQVWTDSWNHVGDDERTRDGVLARPDKRHPDLRVPVDHSFDFLWMNFHSANTNYPIPSSDETVAVAAQFEHIACVYKAIGIGKDPSVLPEIADRSMRRPDPQRAILNLHLDLASRLPDQTRRKARETISDLKRDTRLRRGESVSNHRLRVKELEMIQNGLVRDLT